MVVWRKYFSSLSTFLVFISLTILCWSQKTNAQQGPPRLADTTGIDPDILKMLPIKSQRSFQNLRAQVRGGISNETQVASSRDLIFTVGVNSTGINAVSKATGEVVWFQTFDNTGWRGQVNTLASSPVYDPVSDLVFFVAPDLRLYGLSAADGEPVWNFPGLRLDDYYFTPVVDRDTLCFIKFNNFTNNTEFSGFYTGATFPSTARGRMKYNITVEKSFSRLAKYEGRVYFVQNPYTTEEPIDNQKVSYLTVSGIADGVVTFNDTVGFTITSLPYWVADDEVYFGGSDGVTNKWFYRWSLRGNRPVWRTDLQPKGTVRGGPMLDYPAVDSLQVVDNRYVYVNTRYGELYALDRETGEKVWNVTKQNMTQAKDSSPVIIQNNLVIGSDKASIYVVNLNLTTFSYQANTTKDVISLVPDGNTVYFVDSSGEVGSIFIDYDTNYEPIFRQKHRYFDMRNVDFSFSQYQRFDNFSSEQIFDVVMNITTENVTIGFNGIKSLTNRTDRTEEILVGGLDGQIHDYSNIGSYAHFPKFQRKTHAPIVATGEVFPANESTMIGSLDNVVYGVQMDNNQRWFFNTNGPILAPPVLYNDLLYITSSDGYVYCIDPLRSREDNVTIIFQALIGNWTISTPFGVGSEMYFGTTEGEILGLDLETGEIAAVAQMQGRIFGDGSVDSMGYLYFGDNQGNVAKYGRDGREQWSSLLDGPIYGGVTVRNETVAVGTMSGSMYFLDTGTGRPVKQFENLGSIMTAPVNYNESFYIGSLDGWMYGFNTTDLTILNANQIDKERNITSFSTTASFNQQKILYISTSKLIIDPRGGFIVDDTEDSIIWAVQPPGATKRYTPMGFDGPLVPQPDFEELALEQEFQGPPQTGLDYLKIPQIKAVTPDNTYDFDSVFTASKCIECSDALGRDVAKWIMGILYSQAGIDSQYVSTTCTQVVEDMNHCLAGARRKLLQAGNYQVPFKLRFAMQDPDSERVKTVLSQNANNVSASDTLTNYGATNFKINSVELAPKETVWSKYQRYFIVVICVGGAVIIVLLALCIQAKCRKPNQKRFKKMLKNVGPLGPVMLQGNKIHQKPLLQTENDDGDKFSQRPSDHPQSTVLEEDIEELDEETGQPYNRSRPTTQQQQYNEPPNYKV